jgi:succinyl-CoA synthetase beta subunit
LVDLKVPLVVRLAGNASESGAKTLLEYSAKTPKLQIKVGTDFAEAAKLAVQTAKDITSGP